jgi:hypothetical protein
MYEDRQVWAYKSDSLNRANIEVTHTCYVQVGPWLIQHFNSLFRVPVYSGSVVEDIV